MYVISCRCLLAVFMLYSGVVKLWIVNGQSTTGDDFETDDEKANDYEISKLVDMVAKLRAELRAEKVKSADRITKLEGQLADMAARKLDASKTTTCTCVCT